MKCLLVTSKLTFVPNNYALFLEGVLKHASHLIGGLVFVDNVDLKTVAKIPALAAMGAPRLAFAMGKNFLELPLGKRRAQAAAHGIPVREFSSMNHPQAIAWAREQNFDLIVNARTRDIYRKEILSVPKLGCINVHHGLLPEERGTMCDLFALSEGTNAGFSIHVMTPKLDDGQILLKRVVSQPGELDFVSYIHRSSGIEGEVMGNLLLDIEKNGALPSGVPNHSNAVKYRKLVPSRAAVRAIASKGVRL